jgi:hypothetical protein
MVGVSVTSNLLAVAPPSSPLLTRATFILSLSCEAAPSHVAVNLELNEHDSRWLHKEFTLIHFVITRMENWKKIKIGNVQHN